EGELADLGHPEPHRQGDLARIAGQECTKTAAYNLPDNSEDGEHENRAPEMHYLQRVQKHPSGHKEHRGKHLTDRRNALDNLMSLLGFGHNRSHEKGA